MGAATGPRPGRILPPRSSPGAAPPGRPCRAVRQERKRGWLLDILPALKDRDSFPHGSVFLFH